MNNYWGDNRLDGVSYLGCGDQPVIIKLGLRYYFILIFLLVVSAKWGEGKLGFGLISFAVYLAAYLSLVYIYVVYLSLFYLSRLFVFQYRLSSFFSGDYFFSRLVFVFPVVYLQE